MNIKKASYLAVLFGCFLGTTHADIKDIHFGLRTANTAFQSFCEDYRDRIVDQNNKLTYSPNRYNFILPGYQLANNICNAYRTSTNLTALSLKSASSVADLTLALAGKYGSPETLKDIYHKIQILTPCLSIAPIIASMVFGDRDANNKNQSLYALGLEMASSLFFACLKKPNQNAIDAQNPSYSTKLINYGAYLANAGIYQYFFRNRDNSSIKQIALNLGLGYAARTLMNNYIFPGVHNWNSTPAQKAAFDIMNQFKNRLLLKNYENVNSTVLFDKQFNKYQSQAPEDFKKKLLATQVGHLTLQKYLENQGEQTKNAANAYLTYLQTE